MGKSLVIKGADFSAVSLVKKYAVSLNASPLGGGIVSGAGNYKEGSRVEISAEAKSGYVFKRWSDGNTNAVRTITVGTEPISLTAVFDDIENLLVIKDGCWNSSKKIYEVRDNYYSCENIGVTPGETLNINSEYTQVVVYIAASGTCLGVEQIIPVSGKITIPENYNGEEYAYIAFNWNTAVSSNAIYTRKWTLAEINDLVLNR